MAFPTTSVLDSFDRANEGPPPSSSWTADTGFGSNGLRVVSNVCGATSLSDSFAYWNVSSPGPDCEVFVTVSTKPANGNYCALYLRSVFAGAGSDGYELQLNVATGTDTTQHYRVDNFVFTALGAAINQEFTAGDGLGLEIIGNSLQAYRRSSGVWAALGTTRADSTYTAAGRTGIQIQDTTGRFDDFGAGTVVAAAGHPAMRRLDGFKEARPVEIGRQGVRIF